MVSDFNSLTFILGPEKQASHRNELLPRFFCIQAPCLVRMGSNRNRLSATVECNRNRPQVRNRNWPVSVTGLRGPGTAGASENPDVCSDGLQLSSSDFAKGGPTFGPPCRCIHYFWLPTNLKPSHSPKYKCGNSQPQILILKQGQTCELQGLGFKV